MSALAPQKAPEEAVGSTPSSWSTWAKVRQREHREAQQGTQNAERTLPHTPVSHWLSGQRGEARAKVHTFKQNELTKEHHKVIREGKDKARL